MEVMGAAPFDNKREVPLVPQRAPSRVDVYLDRVRQAPLTFKVASAVVVLAVVASGALLTTGARSRTITGTMTLVDSYRYNADGAGEPCSPGGGYDDISSGGQVTVRDESGATLATGSLSSGRRVRDACEFSFSDSDVRNAKFYEVGMGDDSRGGLQYSADEMHENSWTVALSLGS